MNHIVIDYLAEEELTELKKAGNPVPGYLAEYLKRKEAQSSKAMVAKAGR